MAEKATYQDPSMAFLQFLTGLGGQKQSGSQTSTSAGDPKAIAALTQLLGTQMGQTTPEGAAALIQQIFQKGSEQVPGLGMQFAQSAGARGSNNSPLNLANQQLQARLASEAMAKILEAQSAAGKTAGTLADANKTTTTSSTQTAKAAKPGLAVLPFLIGQAGNLKKLGGGLMDKMGEFGSGADTGFGSVTGGSGGFGQTVNNPSAFVGNAGGVNVTDFLSDASGGVDLGSFADMASATNEAAFAGLDFAGMGLEGLDSILGTAAESGLSAFDFLGFADGGQVKLGGMNMSAAQRREAEAMGEGASKPKQAASAPASGPDTSAGKKSMGVRFFDMINGRYADGGLVKKTLAPGYADGGSVRGVTDFGIGSEDIDLNMFETNPVGSTGANNTAAGSPTGNNQQSPITIDSLSDEVISYFANEQVANPNAYYAGSDGNFYSAQVAQSRPEGEIGDTYNSEITGIRQHGKNFSDDDYYKTTPLDKVYNTDGSFQDVAVNRPPMDPTSMAIQAAITMIGLATTGNPALGFARGVGTKAAVGAADSFFGKTQPPNAFGGTYKGSNNPTRSASATGSNTLGFASGGEVEGPGTGTSDSIPILVSDGEYVIPADTVEALGVDFFDMIKDATHTPVSMQRFHAANVRG